MSENKSEKGLRFWYELRDLLAGAAFPFMLQLIINATFIGLTSSIIQTNDIALSIVMLSIGEVLMGVAYFIFGRQNGATSVKKILNHSKKLEIGSKDKQAEFGTGEYSAYKGFLIALITCVPYMIFQLVQCCAPNSFCGFLLQYVFGWAAIPFTFAENISPWLNFLFVLYPVAVHAFAYIFFAHKEWDKLQRLAATGDAVSGDGKGKNPEK